MHILIPKKHSLGKVCKTNLVLTWLLENKLETNWEDKVIYQMMESQRKRISLLPHGDLIMKILEHIGFNLEDEESISELTRIGKHELEKNKMAD